MDEMIFRKVKKSGGCEACDFYNAGASTDTNACAETKGCSGYIMKLVTETKKLQTEYEWKKERFELLKNSGHGLYADLAEEICSLRSWLQDNKPQKWVECTKENTKIGDIVRRKEVMDIGSYEVRYMCNNKANCFLLANAKSTIDFNSLDRLADYEINIGDE